MRIFGVYDMIVSRNCDSPPYSVEELMLISLALYFFVSNSKKDAIKLIFYDLIEVFKIAIKTLIGQNVKGKNGGV